MSTQTIPAFNTVAEAVAYINEQRRQGIACQLQKPAVKGGKFRVLPMKGKCVSASNRKSAPPKGQAQVLIASVELSDGSMHLSKKCGDGEWQEVTFPSAEAEEEGIFWTASQLEKLGYRRVSMHDAKFPQGNAHVYTFHKLAEPIKEEPKSVREIQIVAYTDEDRQTVKVRRGASDWEDAKIPEGYKFPYQYCAEALIKKGWQQKSIAYVDFDGHPKATLTTFVG